MKMSGENIKLLFPINATFNVVNNINLGHEEKPLGLETPWSNYNTGQSEMAKVRMVYN